MKAKFSKLYPEQSDSDGLPRLKLMLRHRDNKLEVAGLLDSGATVSVLPYQVGLQLGYVWDNRKATLRLGGNLSSQVGQGVVAQAQVGEFPPARLVFAWVQSDDVPLILGHTNFFMEYDVCIFRSAYEFEINPKKDKF